LCKNQRLIKGLLWKWQLKEVADVQWPCFSNRNEFQSCKWEQVWIGLTGDWITPRIMPKGTRTPWLWGRPWRDKLLRVHQWGLLGKSQQSSLTFMHVVFISRCFLLLWNFSPHWTNMGVNESRCWAIQHNAPCMMRSMGTQQQQSTLSLMTVHPRIMCS
jgi:hypothetical protein